MCSPTGKGVENLHAVRLEIDIVIVSCFLVLFLLSAFHVHFVKTLPQKRNRWGYKTLLSQNKEEKQETSKRIITAMATLFFLKTVL